MYFIPLHNIDKCFLQHEVTICRKEQPFIIRPKRLTSLASIDAVPMDVSDSLLSSQSSQLEHLAASNSELTSSNNTQYQSDDPGGGATSSSAGHDPVEASC